MTDFSWARISSSTQLVPDSSHASAIYTSETSFYSFSTDEAWQEADVETFKDLCLANIVHVSLILNVIVDEFFFLLVEKFSLLIYTR